MQCFGRHSARRLLASTRRREATAEISQGRNPWILGAGESVPIRIIRKLSRTPSNGVFASNVSGLTTRATVLGASTDCPTWAPVATNPTSATGLFWLNDPDMTNHPYRFYRGRVP